jgi:hypothetical protein
MAHNYGLNGKVEGSAIERACEGKQDYPTEAAAEAGLKFLRKVRAVRSGDGMVVYKCGFCPGWHFGH